ncbi:MAG: SGNH/GDSL hydrolase family protein [Bdellovibrionales bacterium]|nr:SGNH/GDSL hydrolase family protein [Bdellovibrionales bacterium]
MKTASTTAIFRTITVIFVNILVLAALLLVVEHILQQLDPRNSLPFDGIREGVRYTWGHRVTNNEFGFRERDISIPKPTETFRVMVLGDSLTWGAGVAQAERYTEVAEQLLRDRHPDRRIEILNFGVPGGPTTQYREIANKYATQIDADLLVVGFCINDTQPRPQNYSPEREAFIQQYAPAFRAIRLYSKLAPRTAENLEQLLFAIGEATKMFPPWWDALDRTYQTHSPEWRAFEGALAGIRQLSEQQFLPPPVFLVLELGTSSSAPTDYRDENDEMLNRFRRWHAKAKAAAKDAGFRVFDHEQAFRDELAGQVLAANPLDGHPSPQQHHIYARSLVQAVSEAWHLRRQ